MRMTESDDFHNSVNSFQWERYWAKKTRNERVGQHVPKTTLNDLDSKGAYQCLLSGGSCLKNAAGQMVCTIDIHLPCLLLPLLNEIIEQVSRLSGMVG